MKNLRIFFTLVSAISLAALPFVAAFWFEFIAIPLFLASVSFLLMLRFKKLHELQESPSTPKGDFLNPLPKDTNPVSKEEPCDDTALIGNNSEASNAIHEAEPNPTDNKSEETQSNE